MNEAASELQCGAAGDGDVCGCAAGDGAEEGEAGGSHAQAHQEAGGAAGRSAPKGIGHPPATHSGKQQVEHKYRTFCLIFFSCSRLTIDILHGCYESGMYLREIMILFPVLHLNASL